MFGDEYTDYLADNFDSLINVARKVDTEYHVHLNDVTQLFVKFYNYVLDRSGEYPVGDLIALGITQQQILVLLSLFNARRRTNYRFTEDYRSISFG